MLVLAEHHVPQRRREPAWAATALGNAWDCSRLIVVLRPNGGQIMQSGGIGAAWTPRLSLAGRGC